MNTFSIKMTLSYMNTILTLLNTKQYNEETPDIYNVDKSNSYTTSYHNFSDTQFNTKQQFITHSLTNNITQHNLYITLIIY